MKRFVTTLQDPLWVAKFQQMFGIEIIKQVEKNKNNKWLPVEVRENMGEAVEANDKGKYNIIFYKVNIMNLLFHHINFNFLDPQQTLVSLLQIWFLSGRGDFLCSLL